MTQNMQECLTSYVRLLHISTRVNHAHEYLNADSQSCSNMKCRVSKSVRPVRTAIWEPRLLNCVATLSFDDSTSKLKIVYVRIGVRAAGNILRKSMVETLAGARRQSRMQHV